MSTIGGCQPTTHTSLGARIVQPSFWLDSSARISGDLIEPFRRAGIASQVTRNGSESLGLTGIWAKSV
jgi:hypothetical protein